MRAKKPGLAGFRPDLTLVGQILVWSFFKLVQVIVSKTQLGLVYVKYTYLTCPQYNIIFPFKYVYNNI